MRGVIDARAISYRETIVGQVQRNMDGVIAELLSLSYPRSAYLRSHMHLHDLRRVHARLPRGHEARLLARAFTRSSRSNLA